MTLSCTVGYEGHLCSTCADGYFFHTGCQICHEQRAWLGTAMLSALILLTLAIVLVLIYSPSMFEMEHNLFTVAGIERCHALRSMGRWLLLLWKEAFLLLFQVSFVACLALLGVGSVEQLAAFATGALFLTAYMVFQSIVSYVSRKKQADHVQSTSTQATILSTDLSHVSLPTFMMDRESHAIRRRAVAVRIQTVAKSLVIHVQSVSSIMALIPFRLAPRLFSTTASMFSRANMQISGLSCFGLTYFGEFAALLLTVPCFVLIVAFAYGLRRLMLLRAFARFSAGDWSPAFRRANTLYYNNALDDLKRRALTICAVAVYVFIFPCAQRAFSMFGCSKDPRPDLQPWLASDDPATIKFDAPSWLANAPWIQCDYSTSNYRNLTILAGVSLLFMASGLGIVAYLMVRTVSLQDRTAAARSRVADSTHSSFAFLAQAYRPECWWYEAIVLARRIAIAAITATVPLASGLCVPLLMGALIAAVCVQLRWKPYADPSPTQGELSSMLCLVLCVSLVSSVEAQVPLTALLFVLINSLVVVVHIVHMALPTFRLMQMTARASRRS